MRVVKIGSRQNMLQLQDENGTSWYKIQESNTECLEVVKTLNVNDVVEIHYATTNGIKVINELRLSTDATQEVAEEPSQVVEEKTEVDTNVGSQNNFSTPEKPQEFKCEKCGASLKDGKYKTCYTCSMAARAASGNFNKSPEVQDSIKRQAIGHMTSRTLIALKGSPDLSSNNLEDTMERVYRKYQQLVG